MYPPRPQSASVTIVSASSDTTKHCIDLLADEYTHVEGIATLAGLSSLAQPDVLLLDRTTLATPASDLLRLRARWREVYIVVIGEESSESVGRLLDAGADDVVDGRRPGGIARLRAVTRRARTVNAGRRVRVGDLLYDGHHRRAWCRGLELELTPREFALLSCLTLHSPKIASIRSLVEAGWGGGDTPRHRNLLRVYVSYLRAKLRSSRLVTLRSFRNRGYGLVVATAESGPRSHRDQEEMRGLEDRSRCDSTIVSQLPLRAASH